MTNNLNKLNCMNYMVDNGYEHYYLQNGLRSLYAFCKDQGMPFKVFCLEMLAVGYVVLSDGVTQVAMV